LAILIALAPQRIAGLLQDEISVCCSSLPRVPNPLVPASFLVALIKNDTEVSGVDKGDNPYYGYFQCPHEDSADTSEGHALASLAVLNAVVNLLHQALLQVSRGCISMRIRIN
jgi:hypothetical protein